MLVCLLLGYLNFIFGVGSQDSDLSKDTLNNFGFSVCAAGSAMLLRMVPQAMLLRGLKIHIWAMVVVDIMAGLANMFVACLLAKGASHVSRAVEICIMRMTGEKSWASTAFFALCIMMSALIMAPSLTRVCKRVSLARRCIRDGIRPKLTWTPNIF